MQKLILFFFYSFISITTFAQLSGKQLLDKAIQFHDPEGKWKTFQGTFHINMESPKSTKRESQVTIDLPNEHFKVKMKQNETTIEYVINQGDCMIALDGNSDLTSATKKKYNLSCERANLYKNYYTYLYGLPMKLKDSGTNIEPEVMKVEFKGKQYLVLKVRYDKEVGKDTWFFYFNPKTYALEIYQFLKDSKQNTGEYILLSGMETISGIKMPKNRAWYYNKDDQYLATDILTSSKQID